MKNPDTNLRKERGKGSTQAHRENRVAKLVSFSGMDGAGKSTQIEAFCGALADAGMRYRVIRFWEEVAGLSSFREAVALGIFKSDPGAGSPGFPVNRRDKNVRSWFMTWVRLCLYAVDTLSLRAVIGKMARSDCEVVLFDRFIYDEFANLNLKNPAIRCYVRVMLRIVPRPDIIYFLDADPVQARARKPEYPLEFLRVNREAYVALSRLIRGVTFIGPMTIDEVKREIMKHGAELFSGKDREYVA
jgi:thymidylate kinase